MSDRTDTIAAIATPAGEGGVAVIRVSGPDAGDVARKIWRRVNGGECPELKSHRVYHGNVVDPETGVLIDESVLVYFGHGRSYTGEEVVEINCHGGPFVARRVLEAALSAGARPAGPGEFTRRAFLAGRMDLAQAEAVADLIAASGDRELANARMQLGGELSRRVEAIGERLVVASAEIESVIDFPEEEDVGALQVGRLKELLTKSFDELKELADSYREGRALREGYRLTIVGRPNVGKSSLLNRFLGADRAIVNEEAGTTRDSIEERVVWRGTPFLLVDTAGVGPARLGSPDHQAVEKSRELARRNAIDPVMGALIVLMDVSEPVAPEDLDVLEMAKNAPHVLVFNKCDLPHKLDWASLPEPWKNDEPVLISALKGEGVAALTSKIVARRAETGNAPRSEGYLLSAARHFSAVKKAAESLGRAIRALENGESPEFVALDVRLARDALDEIVGAAGIEEILDVIFSRFCVGK